ncbi:MULTISPECIES: dTDP-glucose 4,6-dehydratase [unclassified Streptomyces]|uniref:dTDP-glucose 4,6-dehydratase n=1 Tax=unclassified Streptomyces TaxID=2593676 RepID=UPI00225BE404|nr:MULTISPECIES: dTDP-glucose 4,6-dehydratase [unclassified Streptomyces]MCX4527162.1 dTDP-glucose 4,6-dehydratase [Streptomyces sp. NBC_01551]MCX4542262.1 dTDP-glucose 4,6-dehydratase [Streptomyces sp. NBC_01565]
MRILVTGGAGFIGSHYVRTMLDGGYPGYEDAHVTVLDLLTYAGNRDNLPASHPRLTFVRGDILDRELLRSVLDGQDAVVHFAAESHVDRSIESGTAFVRTNVEGTQAVLDACLAVGVERVVHVSTDEVYGSIDEGFWTEESPLLPNSPYAASKAASDLIALAFFRTHRLNVSVTRCSNNYGPFQHPEKFIPLSVTNLLEGRPIPVYGDGQQIREWLHVDDHCRAVHRVLTGGRAGEAYNIGAGTHAANLTLAHRLVELCGADPGLIRHVGDRKGHDRRYALDQGKIERELGHRPLTAFDKGLAQTVAWYQDNPQWWKPVKESGDRP